jgi:pyridinium-3,5-bisthiocarboxylic acid mononucleotide nickel chelatase
MSILIYDPFAGISGDMHLGAMVDLGVPEDYIRENLNALDLPGWSLEFKREKRMGITGTRALVTAKAGGPNSPDIPHRKLKDIREIILSSSLEEKIKNRAIKMFTLIGEAEAKVHDTDLDSIHFHEVGAVDSIVDIVAAAACIEFLAPEQVLSGPPELGGGFVRCAHGLIPVPAPATVEILAGVPIRSGAVGKETTTPTGAAILKANVHSFTGGPGQMTFGEVYSITRTGYGVGGRDLPIPNLLRVYLAEPGVSSDRTGAVMLECNIDDMNPELYEHLLDRLFEEGVKDAYLTPITMKKGRPGTLLTVMTTEEIKERVKGTIFLETTTGGVREYRVDQTMLERRFSETSTPFGKVRIKRLFLAGEQVSWKAEYEDVRRLAVKHKVPMKTIYDTIGP